MEGLVVDLLHIHDLSLPSLMYPISIEINFYSVKTLLPLFKQVLGACWYLLSIERQEACWRRVCYDKKPSCEYGFFDCHRANDFNRTAWFQSSNLSGLCNPLSGFYEFGIYSDAVTSEVTASPFFNKYFYCLWWGLRNLR